MRNQTEVKSESKALYFKRKLAGYSYFNSQLVWKESRSDMICREQKDFKNKN